MQLPRTGNTMGKNWWCFWKSASDIPTDDATIVNVHMDKKWFFAVKSRSNCKELTFIGLEGTIAMYSTKVILAKNYTLLQQPLDKTFPICCIWCGDL